MRTTQERGSLQCKSFLGSSSFRNIYIEKPLNQPIANMAFTI